MNFYELTNQINNTQANNAQIGNNQNQNSDSVVQKNTGVAETDPSLDKNGFMRVVKNLSVKLKENSNKYVPLVRYASRDPKMLSLLEQLIEETSKMQANKARGLF